MKTFKTREEVIGFLLEEGKTCNFARAAINIMGKEWPCCPRGLLYGYLDGEEECIVPMIYNEMEILAMYRAIEPLLSIVDDTIHVDGIPLFNICGWPL